MILENHTRVWVPQPSKCLMGPPCSCHWSTHWVSAPRLSGGGGRGGEVETKGLPRGSGIRSGMEGLSLRRQRVAAVGEPLPGQLCGQCCLPGSTPRRACTAG